MDNSLAVNIEPLLLNGALDHIKVLKGRYRELVSTFLGIKPVSMIWRKSEHKRFDWEPDLDEVLVVVDKIKSELRWPLEILVDSKFYYIYHREAFELIRSRFYPDMSYESIFHLLNNDDLRVIRGGYLLGGDDYRLNFSAMSYFYSYKVLRSNVMNIYFVQHRNGQPFTTPFGLDVSNLLFLFSMIESHTDKGSVAYRYVEFY